MFGPTFRIDEQLSSMNVIWLMPSLNTPFTNLQEMSHGFIQGATREIALKTVSCHGCQELQAHLQYISAKSVTARLRKIQSSKI